MVIGKLAPTSSHLFKLILPLGHLAGQLAAGRSTPSSPAPPTVFLLHPTQPLSHVSRLITASLSPAEPTIAFRSTTRSGKDFQWSDATDVADFVRDAAQATEFVIHIAKGKARSVTEATSQAAVDEGASEAEIRVEVPTFADRTRFLRRRLEIIGEEMKSMEDLKQLCDREAHRSARRLALSGFGVLVCYWGAVARLTFWDLGWYMDVVSMRS
jgi:calcium uniporter protein, mitochondrial